MANLSALDWLVFAFVGYMAFMGYRRGLLLEVLSLVALAMAIYVGITCRQLIAGVLGSFMPAANLAGSFTGVGITVFVGYRLLMFAAGLASKAVKASALGFADQLTGGLLGMAKACLVIGALAWLWVRLPGTNKQVLANASAPCKTFIEVGQWEVRGLAKAVFKYEE